MFLKADEEFIDYNFQLLSSLLKKLDDELTDINRLILSIDDPESYGLTDRGEYLIGVGFSAMQQYMTETLSMTGLNKNHALDIGPKHNKESTVISIVNAAANWWKHSAEWANQSEISNLSRRTQAKIMGVTNTNMYQLSNVLAELLGTSEITLSALLPSLALWRSDVDNHSQKHH
ncbi:hypothetical protein [Atopomonas hussainii]|uniref:hypothetical protein n=1 Tax=Atopomonas hussainii TaxID=1429083 RepID=UPI0008FFF8FC|nr:hypothetical protein [Atopomonas hussainii]